MDVSNSMRDGGLCTLGDDGKDEHVLLPAGSRAVSGGASQTIADNGTNFKGGQLLLEVKNQIDISEAQKKLNIEFRFAPPRAPHFMGLVERILGAAKAALKPALRTTAASGEELQTVVAKTMGILNNFPIAYTIRSDVDFHYRPLPPKHFLMGQP
jgi:hypothetical protein